MRLQVNAGARNRAAVRDQTLALSVIKFPRDIKEFRCRDCVNSFRLSMLGHTEGSNVAYFEMRV